MGIHVLGYVCGHDQRGGVHAVEFKRPKRRVTLDAVCGVRVRLTGAATTTGDTISLVWPPYIEGALSIGLIRCKECYQKTGGRPSDMMGTAQWHALRRKKSKTYGADLIEVRASR